MRKPSRLQRRRQTWYLRQAVPHELRPVVGKSEIVRSLKTRDYVEAGRRLPLAAAEVEAELARARRQLRRQPATAMDEHEMRQAVLSWFWQAEREAEARRAPDDREAALEHADLDAGVLADAADENVLATAEPVAEAIMREANVALDRGGDEFHRLVELVRRGLLEQAKRNEARLHGDFAAEYDPAFRGVGPQAPEPPTPEPRGVTLADLVDLYMGDPARAGVTAKTVLDYNYAFKVLKEVVGPETPARQVTRDDLRRVRDLLMKLPPNASKRWPEMPLTEVAAMATAQGIAPMQPRTANAILNKIGALFGWAVREEYMDKNPASGLRVAEPEIHAREARQPLTTDDLEKLFAMPLYTGCQDDAHGYDKPGPNVIKRWRYFLLPVAIYSGMRLNEIMSLQVADIEQRDGVWCFVVRPGDGKRLKTTSATRVIPIHPKLVEMGLLDYHARMVERGETTWLWPEVEPDARGYRSDAAQKWAARFFAKAGVKRPRVSMHSARHLWRDKMDEVGCPVGLARYMGGWSGSNVSENYGGAPSPTALLRWISNVDYEIDLTRSAGARGHSTIRTRRRR